MRLVEELLRCAENDDELHPELRKELVARLEAIEDGTAVLLDHDEMMRQLRAKNDRVRECSLR